MSDYALLQSAEPDLRIVLVGKTGCGKSSAGNTILGRRAFETKYISSEASECQKETGEFEGQKLAVVDTPGMFDTRQHEVITEIIRCISFSAPGPHVFLVVIKADRFTEEEQKTVKIIQLIFGEAAAHYTVVLFTHGDTLEEDGVTIDEFIKEDENLSNFISQCGRRYHVFNNRDKDPSQVRELLKKINSMVQINGGSYYTNEMFRETERAIEEEMEILLTEHINMDPEEARSLADSENWLMQSLKTVAGATVGGATVGATIAGALVGAVGLTVGAAAGAALGGLVGVGTAVAGAYKN